MQIIGHKLVKFEHFNMVYGLNNIIKFDNLLFKYDKNFIKLALELNKNFSIIVANANEALLANAVGAKFIIIDKSEILLIKDVVKFAEFYLFDSKIAIVIKELDELSEIANLGADTAIFANAIEHISY